MASLDERQAYDAMRAFLIAFWERGNRVSDDIEEVIRWTEWEPDGGTYDPAMWSDWLNAVRRVLG